MDAPGSEVCPKATTMTIAVGTAIAGRPPHRSVRAELPHTALPLGGDGRDVFGAQYTARLYLCERFDVQVAQHNASLEAKATG